MMDFGEALKALKEGKKVAREGWNAKHYIYLCIGQTVPLNKWQERSPSHSLTDHERLSGRVVILPHIDMMTAHGERVIGWLASQTDMLSEDWVIVE